jgi:hypothetical protein
MPIAPGWLERALVARLEQRVALYPPPEQGENGSVLFGWFVSAVLFTMTWALLAGAIMKKRKRRPRKEG